MCESSRWVDLLVFHINIYYIFAGSSVPGDLDLVNDIKLAFCATLFSAENLKS